MIIEGCMHLTYIWEDFGRWQDMSKSCQGGQFLTEEIAGSEAEA